MTIVRHGLFSGMTYYGTDIRPVVRHPIDGTCLETVACLGLMGVVGAELIMSLILIVGLLAWLMTAW